jgi:hypothetical protein
VPKVVEATFRHWVEVLNLHVGGQIIRTTAKHPFFVYDRGWVPAVDLKIGEALRSHDGHWVAVEGVAASGQKELVFNLRVADYHTYFVGCKEWGFSVWAHNLCNLWNEFQAATSGQFKAGEAAKAYNGSTTWTSAGGLEYGSGSVHGSRIKHVLAHGVPDPSKLVHTVFSGSPRDIFATVDAAWGSRGVSVPGDPGKFIVPMGRVVGTSGETSVTVIVRPGTNQIITAFPS